MLRRLFSILVLLAVVGVVAWGLRPRPILVDAAAVVRGPVTVTVDEDGRTRIRDRWIVSSPLAGRLLRVRLHAGDGVVADETVIARIEPVRPGLLDARARAEAAARVRSAEAEVERSRQVLATEEADRDHCVQEFDRARRLLEKGVIGRDEHDDCSAALRVAEGRVRAAGFALEVARFDLEQAQAALLRTDPEGRPSEDWHLVVRSPVTGRVLRVIEESATVVTPGTPLVELGDPADLEVVVDVLSEAAVTIRPGDRASIENWGGSAPLEARVRLVEPAARTRVSALGVEEQRVDVVLDFTGDPAAREALGDGFRVEARIVVDERDDTRLVPAGALFRLEGDWCVFALDGPPGDRRARRRTLALGLRNDRVAEVLEGLDEGDLVVLHPPDTVDDGIAVATADEE